MISGTQAIPADSGVLANSPSATVSQLVAKRDQHDETDRAEPVEELADGRNPSAKATR
jgi:hypothetical protein